ncbi:MAG: biotin/lipoyl-binding protein [Negativicutes bacterium]|jgi:biotin carboxyl carrier protein|nr:biotin/lipoyl-binding protein [Negativicutes bacterium]
MKNFRIKVASLFAILALSITMVVFAAGVIDHSAVLNGKVAAQGLVKVNDTVQEGQVLVSVETLTGVAPTSRAKVTGVVTEVLVTPGQSVKTGQIVVKVESQNP